MRLFSAAKLVRAYLPPALTARLATTPPDFMPPVHDSNALKSEITTKTLWSGGRGLGGSSMARSRPALRGRAAELEAEREVLAPWRAAIAGARLAKREALAERREARIAKSRQGPYGASVGGRTCSMDRSEEAAAVDAGLGAARLRAMAGGEAGIDATVENPCGASSGAGIGAAVTAPQAAGGPMGVRVGIRRAGGFGATLAPTPPPNLGPLRGPSPQGKGESLSLHAVIPTLMGSILAMTQCAPAVTKSANHDKDPMDRRTVRWPWGGLKGRLCRGTPLGGLLPGVTQPGTWQAVLEASDAEEELLISACAAPSAVDLADKRTEPPPAYLHGGYFDTKGPAVPAPTSAPTPPPDENAARHASLLACCGAQRRQ
jgi:hypothetical protein